MAAIVDSQDESWRFRGLINLLLKFRRDDGILRAMNHKNGHVDASKLLACLELSRDGQSDSGEKPKDSPRNGAQRRERSFEDEAAHIGVRGEMCRYGGPKGLPERNDCLRTDSLRLNKVCVGGIRVAVEARFAWAALAATVAAVFER